MEEIKQFLEKLFEMLEVKAEVEVLEKDEESIINIKSDQASLLIGYHGDTINSLEHIVNLVCLNKTGEWENVRLDVDGYKEMRKNKITEIAEKAADRVRFSQRPVALLPMNSFERKVIHEFVSKTDDLSSESEGDGRNRRVIIKLKDSSLPIDRDKASSE